MDRQTLDRAYEIICDQPGITRSGLMKSMKISSPTAGRYIATLRDVQKRIVRAGLGYYPADQNDQNDQNDQHRDLKDLPHKRSERSERSERSIRSTVMQSIGMV